MSDYALLLISALLVNNLMLAQFLGLCPVIGISRGLRTAMVVALVTVFVLTLSAAVNHVVYEYLLRPLHLEYLRTMAFMVAIVAIAAIAQWVASRTRPALHTNLGDFLPLIAMNSATLGVPLLNMQASHGFIQSILYGFGGAIGISLVLVLFAAMRERIAVAEVPETFKGNAIGLITIGLMSLAFMGFLGLTNV
jgi:electron transport complex protein RnfA